MAIYRKDHLEPYLKEVEQYHWEVRRALSGEPPNPNVAAQFHASPEQFAQEYADVDFDRVLRCIDRFNATVRSLRQLKGKAAKPVHRP